MSQNLQVKVMMERMCVILVTMVTVARCAVTLLPYAMMEERPPGWVVADLSLAVQKRYVRGEKVEFALLPQNGDLRNYFTIEKDTNLLKVKAPFDRDVMAPNAENYVITLQAALISPDFEPFRIQISIDDINDHAPSFADARHVLHVSESSLAGKSFPLPLAVDPDSPQFSVNQYRLLSNSSLFTLREVRAEGQLEAVRLELRHNLDRETMPRVTVRMLAIDGGIPSRTGTLTVDILVTDSNDHSPVFDSDIYEVSVPENTPVNTILVTVRATDADDGVNARMMYALSAMTSKQHGHVFAINNTTGDIRLLTRLRYEVQDSYTLTVDARDLGLEPLSGRTKVMISVIDINDHAPEITLNPWGTEEKIKVMEGEPQGTLVAFVYVNDKDSGVNGDITCDLDTRLFALAKVDSRYYRVVTSAVFDREVKDKYDVGITCSDRGMPSKSTSERFSVAIADANDNTPQFEQDAYVATVPENVTGSDVITVKAIDRDLGENARITYELQGYVAQYFTIDQTTGEIRVKDGLDYEKGKSVQLTIYASDAGKPRHSSTAVLTVYLIDINDESPVFSRQSYAFHAVEGGAEGLTVGHVNVTDRDSPPFNSFLLSLKDNFNGTFSIHPSSGQISARRSLDREKQPFYRLVVVASDLAEPKWNTSVDVTVHVDDINDNAPELYIIDDVIHVPTRAERGYKVAEFKVKDADIGVNALQTYSLIEDISIDEGYFRIQSFTGVLTVDKDLTPINGKTLHMNVTVQDGGVVRLKDTLQLTVVINGSIKYETPVHGNHSNRPPTAAAHILGLLRYREMIVVLLISVTAVFVTVLVTAIVCLKVRQSRHRHGKEDRRYGNRPEKELGKTTTDDYITPEESDKKMADDCSRNTVERYPMVTTNSREVYRQHDVTSAPVISGSLSTPGNYSNHNHAASLDVWQKAVTPSNSKYRNRDLLSPPEKLASLATDDSDSIASGTSVNDSNTDSGRGGSDEGGEGGRGRGGGCGGEGPTLCPPHPPPPPGGSATLLTRPHHLKSILQAHEQALNSLPRLPEHPAEDIADKQKDKPAKIGTLATEPLEKRVDLYRVVPTAGFASVNGSRAEIKSRSLKFADV